MTITPPTPPAPPPPSDPPAPPAGETKTFTQSELDAIVRDRLGREKAKFSDYDDIKAKASKYDEIDAASKSELEKAQGKIAEAERRADAAQARAVEATMRSAIQAAALKANAVDPDAVFALLDKSAVTVGDDGQVTGIDVALKALLDAKPYLVGKPTPRGGADGGAIGGPVPGQLTREDLKGMSSAEIVKAKNDGRLKHIMGTG